MKKPKHRTRCPSAATLLTFLPEGERERGYAPGIVEHWAHCALCQEVAETLQAFMRRDVVEEVAEAYREVTVLDLVAQQDQAR